MAQSGPDFFDAIHHGQRSVVESRCFKHQVNLFAEFGCDVDQCVQGKQSHLASQEIIHPWLGDRAVLGRLSLRPSFGLNDLAYLNHQLRACLEVCHLLRSAVRLLRGDLSDKGANYGFSSRFCM